MGDDVLLFLDPDFRPYYAKPGMVQIDPVTGYFHKVYCGHGPLPLLALFRMDGKVLVHKCVGDFTSLPRK